jgi:hypothetical protein
MEKLTITIDTNDPIPIDVFNKSLSALSHQYKTVTNESSELYISKLKEGSYIIELVSIAIAATLPVLSNANTVVQFVEYLRLAKNWLMGISGKPKSIQISQNDLKEYKELLAPAMVVNNYGSMNFYHSDQDSIKFEKREIESIAKAVDREIVVYEKPIVQISIPDHFNKVLFYWYQTRFDDENINLGNKGIIEAIDKDPKNVVFADDCSDTKKEMTTIHPDIKVDWQVIGYIVDVEVIKKGNEVKAYKILKNYMNDCIIN